MLLVLTQRLSAEDVFVAQAAQRIRHEYEQRVRAERQHLEAQRQRQEAQDQRTLMAFVLLQMGYLPGVAPYQLEGRQARAVPNQGHALQRGYTLPYPMQHRQHRAAQASQDCPCHGNCQCSSRTSARSCRNSALVLAQPSSAAWPTAWRSAPNNSRCHYHRGRATSSALPFEALFTMPQPVESYPDPDLLDFESLVPKSNLKRAGSEAKKTTQEKRVSFQAPERVDTQPFDYSDLLDAAQARSRVLGSQNGQMKRSKSNVASAPTASSSRHHSSVSTPPAPQAAKAGARYPRYPNPHANAFYNWYAAHQAELNALAKANENAEQAKAARDPNVTLERKPAVRKATSTPSTAAAAPQPKEDSKDRSLSDIEKEKEAEAEAVAAEQARLIRRYDSLSSLTSIRSEFLAAQVSASPHATPVSEEPTELAPSVDAAPADTTAATSKPASAKLYEETLLRLLERLDGVESDGDDVIRFTRRSLARELADELEVLDKAKSDGKVEVESAEESKKDAFVDDGVKVELEVEVVGDIIEPVQSIAEQGDATPFVDIDHRPEEVFVKEEVPTQQPRVLESVQLSEVEASSSTTDEVVEREPVAVPDLMENTNATPDLALGGAIPIPIPLETVGVAESSVDTEVQTEALLESPAEDSIDSEEPAHTFPPPRTTVNPDRVELNGLTYPFSTPNDNVDSTLNEETTSTSTTTTSEDARSELGSSPIDADASPQRALTELGSDIVVLTDEEEASHSDSVASLGIGREELLSCNAVELSDASEAEVRGDAEKFEVL